ncbi:lycopene cyclase domain-containing protein [Microbacterium aurantiacum]|uniref:lycopene cyclase domain-containing protein n=1 Tax=Microbacterium aurantiacum TaxID=162393 RepID=UPI000C8010C7|nr:lycopene cyclase domain-containing protein [Microbacterium aurantiacum]
MSYAMLAVCFLAIAGTAGAALPLLARTRGPSASALVITATGLVLLTAVFDSAMIAAELFHYAPSRLLGLHIGLAPVEDFAYPLAAALLLPSVWVVLIRRRRQRAEARR